MAQKRMFDNAIIDQDVFMDLPNESKALYFLLGMKADDDGFVSPRATMRVHQISNDALRVLIAKKFVIPFESGVVVITDWKRNNWMDKRRTTRTIYTKELDHLKIESGRYELKNDPSGKEENECTNNCCGYDAPRQSNSLEQSAKNQVYFDTRTRTFVPYGEEPKEKQPDDDPLKGLTGQERYYKQMELEMEQKRKAFAQSLMNPQTQSKEDEIIPLENPEPNPEPELKLQKNQVSNATLERVKFGNEIRQIMEHLDRKTHTEGRIVTVDTILALTKWLADGFRVEDIQRMISYKCKQWISDEKMKVWLIPSTLFGEKHFKEYMEQSAGYQDLEDECRRKYNYL